MHEGCMRMDIGHPQVAWGPCVGNMGTQAPAAGAIGCIEWHAGGDWQVSPQHGRQQGWVGPGSNPREPSGCGG